MADRIAILLGIPSSREEFIDRANDPLWDYGRKLLAERSAQAAYSEFYEPVCCAAADLLHRSLTYGIDVRRMATLDDLRVAAERSDVIVIVAHWRDYTAYETDLLDGWPRILSDVAASGTVLHEIATEVACVYQVDVRSLPDILSNTRSTRERVANAINRVIDGNRLGVWITAALRGITTHHLIRKTIARDLIDEAFAGTLQYGNQLELVDGLHSMAAVRDALSNFHGTLDLSCCTSSILGTSLKLARGDAIRVMIGDHLIVPAPQLQLFDATLDVLHTRPSLKYADVKALLADGLAAACKTLQTQKGQ